MSGGPEQFLFFLSVVGLLAVAVWERVRNDDSLLSSISDFSTPLVLRLLTWLPIRTRLHIANAKVVRLMQPKGCVYSTGPPQSDARPSRQKVTTIVQTSVPLRFENSRSLRTKASTSPPLPRVNNSAVASIGDRSNRCSQS